MAIFTNQATLTYNGNVITSNIATGELIEVLTASKTAVIGTYSQNSEITYVINIINSGSSALTGLTVTDDLGRYSFDSTTLVPLDYVPNSVQYYVNGVLQPAPTVTVGPPLLISGISVPGNGVVTIIYVAETNQYAPLSLGTDITNTAVIRADSITNVTVTETVTPEADAQLTITKNLSPTTVTENGQLTYTFTIQNTGNVPIVATDNVVISDLFNPILSNLNVSFNGVLWNTPANYSYSEISGQFTTVPGQVTVPAAVYTQDVTTGAWTITPGVSVLSVTGTI